MSEMNKLANLMRRFRTPLVALILWLLTTENALQAAAISRVELSDGSEVILIEGVIEDGDERQFSDIVSLTKQAVVVLNSEGGKVLSALEIGRAIKQRALPTAVVSDGLCVSACALIWLAGIPRYVAESGKIGFHAAYVVQDGELKETGSGNALVGAYLHEIGLSSDAILFVTSAPPEGMDWLTPKRAAEAGITYAELREEAEDPPAATKEEPVGVLDVVVSFYRALSLADGEAASALVIPEKRGKGPFNESSIRNYFGSMSAPLKLTELKLLDDNMVRVRYSYLTASGRSCDGRADVWTTSQFGRLFVERIKALDGC